MLKFLSKNIVKSIIGYLAVNSLIKNNNILVKDKMEQILMVEDSNQSNLDPSCKVINNNKRPKANKTIP